MSSLDSLFLWFVALLSCTTLCAHAQTARTLAPSGNDAAVVRPPAPSSVVWNGYFGNYVPWASPEEAALFLKGQELFEHTWSAKEGLGPYFNARSCVVCHRIPLPGGAGTSSDTFVPHLLAYRDPSGGSTLPRYKLGDDGKLVSLPIPSGATLRKTPPLFGLGLLEAVPDEVLRANAERGIRKRCGGRAVRIGTTYGRFGWKATVPTLKAFVETALVSELGLTSAKFQMDGSGSSTEEIKTEELGFITSYLQLLAAPAPHIRDARAVEHGRRLFLRCACADCHLSELHASWPVESGAQDITLRAYTDLLVHHMGPTLRDGIRDSGVSEDEFRTAPLWGVWAAGPPYLHDGRARDLSEAVGLHDGEAKGAADAYRALSNDDRDYLIEFLKSL